MSTWLNRVSIVGPRNGTASHTFDPSSSTNVVGGTPFTPTAGRLLVVVGGGPVTATTPTGWTLPAGGSAVNTSGCYCWHRTAAGGDTFTTTHNGSGYLYVVDIFEFPAGSTFVKAAAQAAVSSGSASTAIAGLAGTNTNIHTRTTNHQSGAVPSHTWTAPPAEITDYGATQDINGNDGVGFTTGGVEDDTAASRAFTVTNSLGFSAETVTFSVNVAGPPAPPNEGSANSDATGDVWAIAGMNITSDGSF